MRFIPVAEAAKMLNIHKNTLYRLARQGGIPAIRVGRSVRISEEHLRRMIVAREIEGLGSENSPSKEERAHER